MITPQTLDSLRGKDILLSALVRWFETRDTKQRPIILNIGSVGQPGRHPQRLEKHSWDIRKKYVQMLQTL